MNAQREDLLPGRTSDRHACRTRLAMNWPRIVAMMQELSERFEIAGCALVDPATGWIWHSCGDRPQGPEIWEAAVDYWRLHDRQRVTFGAIGDLAAVVLYHRRGALAVLPCCAEPRLHMVCLAEHGRVDWMAWQRAVREIGELLRAAPPPPRAL
jgi:hypothetical protein